MDVIVPVPVAAHYLQDAQEPSVSQFSHRTINQSKKALTAVSKLSWKPDVGLLDSQSLRGLCAPLNATPRFKKERLEQLQLAAALLIYDALESLSHTAVNRLESHFLRYYRWMQSELETIYAGHAASVPFETFQDFVEHPEKKRNLYTTVECHDAEGAFLIGMGKNIARILCKEMDPKQLMFGSTNMLELHDKVLYPESVRRQLQKYLSLVQVSDRELRVLEVGAGIGSSTAIVLDSLCDRQLSPNGMPKVKQYCFTDVSPRLFPEARNRFKGWENIMEYKTLDIEKDPGLQGFDATRFDLVIAGNVIHTTSDPERTKQSLWPSLAFGLLPKWWEGTQVNGGMFPLLPLERWETQLHKAGFSGIDIDLSDARDPELGQLHVIISTADVRPPEEQPKEKGRDVIIVCKSTAQMELVGENLKRQILQQSPTMRCSIVNICDPNVFEGDVSSALCIVLLQLDESPTHEISGQELSAINQLLLKCRNLLWVTNDKGEQTRLGITTNCVRTTRSKRAAEDVNFTIFTIPSTTRSRSNRPRLISRLLHHVFEAPNKDRQNTEYRYRYGVIQSLNTPTHIGIAYYFPTETRILHQQYETVAHQLLQVV